MKSRDNSSKFIAKNDIILIGIILLFAIIGAFYLFVLRGSGDFVKVSVDGEIYATYSLSKDTTEEIHTGSNNEHSNRLVIRDGKAYIETATCPDGICVAHTPIFREGESIVCLPNKVVITIEVSDDINDLDVVI